MAISASASAAPRTYILADKNGKKQVTFESKAPVEYIEGVAEGLQGTITLDPEKPDLGLSAMISVAVDRMLTGNSIRDEHLRSDDWLNSSRNPTIRFDLAPSDKRSVVKKGEGVWFVKATGSFFLKGISEYITVPVTLRINKDKLYVDGRFSVNLEQHNIRVPTGAEIIGVKVSPDVHVNFRLVGVAGNRK